MKRPASLVPGLLAAIAFGSVSGSVSARSSHTPPAVALTYRGGPLLQNVRVMTLFWGSQWNGSPLAGSLNDFFRTLFADGRYMAHLGEYGVSRFPIGNGILAATATDSQQPPAKLHDAAIRTELRAQIAAGHLPPPDQNSVYVVVTPLGVEVFDPSGGNSIDDFYSYHDWVPGSDGFPYIVVPYDDTQGTAQDSMTLDLSHELAETVTDPDPDDRESELGWFDVHYGEIADIVDTLYNDGLITASDYAAQLIGPDGATYVVEKFWSVKQNAPVAF